MVARAHPGDWVRGRDGRDDVAVPRIVALVVVAITMTLGACSSGPVTESTGSSTGSSIPVSAPAATDNPFLPAQENVTDCISALERPDCGSASKGGGHQLLVLVALVLGLAVIGWRVIVGVRRAERVRHG